MANTYQIAQLLSETLNSDSSVVRNAEQNLDRLSLSSDFAFSLLSLVNGDVNQGLKVAGATYLKNLIRRNVYGNDGEIVLFSKDFKDKLLETLLRVELPVLRVLVEAFSFVVDAEFVKNSWPELVPQVRFAVENSDIISGNANCGLLTRNALKALQALVRPFQYFLNPKVAKEPVPSQLEQVAKVIFVPLFAVFHGFTEKAIIAEGSLNIETENVLLIVCKCAYFSMRSYMPASIAPLLPSFCVDLYSILDSLSLDDSSEGCQQVRLKTGKRILLIFCALVTRHRKYSDKLMPDILKCVLRITRCSANISNLDCLSERVISLAFDVISHILETGPGWKLVSPHFASLLDDAIFPALRLNSKDILEWEEDADEFMSKNLPSDLEEISGWREDLFTARKSAMNLLGVLSMSKGPPMVTNSHNFTSSLKRKKGEKKKGKEQRSSVGELLVFPFLSKFPIPSDANASDPSISNNYYGVLMGFGALQDFLGEKNPDQTSNLIRNRVLPLYKVSISHPYMLAAANWILGELASCLSEDLTADVYSALFKALVTPDCEDASFYPVRASAVGAMVKLLENEYFPPDWLPVLQVIIGRIGDEEEEMSMLFQLLSSVVEAGEKDVAVHIPLVLSQLIEAIMKYLPTNSEQWPQGVIKGFSALAVMAKSWQDSVPEEDEQEHLTEKWASDQKTLARAFSALLQQAWLTKDILEDDDTLPASCLDDASTIFWFILKSTTSSDAILEFKVPELLSVWAEIIADWHGWEEVEDLAIFDCIKELVILQKNLGMPKFLIAKMPSPPAPPVPEKSLIENVATFICEAMSQYPSAASRACACVHMLLHLPYSSDVEEVKRSLAAAFSQAAVLRLKEIQSEPCPLWKQLLLVLSSCYLYYPDSVQSFLEKIEGGFAAWISSLNSISSASSSPNATTVPEIKLIVLTLAKVVEQLLSMGSSTSGLSWGCFNSLMSAFVRLKELQEANSEDEENEEIEDEEEEDDGDDDDDEDSDDDDVHEETEEEFLKRYAEVAVALENGTFAEEGDSEDLDEELELGSLEELDPQKILESLMDRYHQILIQQKQSLPPQLVVCLSSFFPQYTALFQ